jgi:transposase-like protein
MCKNKIQFQQGLSLQGFLSQFGSEDQCRNALVHWRWPQGFVCPSCGHTKYCLLKTRNLFQCNQCRAQISITAGTIFDSTKLSLTIWFLSIYLITQSKVSVSALSLKRTIGVSYNTALLIKHKIQQVMKERDDSKPLDGEYIQADDAYWGGKKHDGIRGRGATGKIPFVAAVSISDKGHPIAIRFSQVSAFSKEAIKAWAQQHLTPKRNVVTDGLECFTAFKESGHYHIAFITGGGPESVKMPEFKWVNTIIGNVKNALRGTFHAISKKHFPRYLAEFCYRFNRRYDLKQMIARFGYIAVRTTPAPQRLLKVAELCG